MPFSAPPEKYTDSPAPRLLPAGACLWRVHSKCHGATEFKSSLADRHFGGGRFDATADDQYDFLYAALTETTALAETLVRSLPFTEQRERILPRREVRERRLCELRTRDDLKLISLLTQPDLAAVRQDEWLVRAEPGEYAFTRRWAHWMRQQADWAQGLIWSSRRDLGECSIVLFRDRCPDDLLRIGDQGCQDLGDSAGAAMLNRLLAPYRVRVYPPRPRVPAADAGTRHVTA